MKKNNFLRRGLSLLLAFVLAEGYLVPARAVENGSELKLGIEQIGNDAVSAELPLAQVDRADESQADASEAVRVSIELEKASSMDAGFEPKGITADAAGMDYRDSLKRNQENVYIDEWAFAHTSIEP